MANRILPCVNTWTARTAVPEPLEYAVFPAAQRSGLMGSELRVEPVFWSIHKATEFKSHGDADWQSCNLLLARVKPAWCEYFTVQRQASI